jgi:hypothetical protein
MQQIAKEALEPKAGLKFVRTNEPDPPLFQDGGTGPQPEEREYCEEREY